MKMYPIAHGSLAGQIVGGFPIVVIGLRSKEYPNVVIGFRSKEYPKEWSPEEMSNVEGIYQETNRRGPDSSRSCAAGVATNTPSRPQLRRTICLHVMLILTPIPAPAANTPCL